MEVHFPHGAITTHADALTLDLSAKLLEPGKEMTRLRVHLKDGSRVKVLGFGKPFAHPGNPSDGWLRHQKPIIGQRTLVDIIQQRDFVFIVAGPRDKLEATWNSPLPPPFSYPYGTVHSWNPERYRDKFSKIKGGQFLAAWGFDTDNEHLAATSLSQAQDVFWLIEAAKKIRKRQFLAYFVPMISWGNATEPGNYFVIVLDSKGIRERFTQAWLRLASADDAFHVNIFGDDPEKPGDWDAKFVEVPQLYRALDDHPVSASDFVLQVRRPDKRKLSRQPDMKVTTFESRSAANAALKQDGQQ